MRYLKWYLIATSILTIYSAIAFVVEGDFDFFTLWLGVDAIAVLVFIYLLNREGK